jgi:hypothetical protein
MEEVWVAVLLMPMTSEHKYNTTDVSNCPDIKLKC